MHRRFWLGLSFVLAWLVMAATPAHADAPRWRGVPPLPQGGTGTTPRPPTADPWREVRPLPPLQGLGSGATPSAAPLNQALPIPPVGPLGALGVIANAGKWTVEAGMGVASGIMQQVVGLEQLTVSIIMGTPGQSLPSDYPQGCAHEDLARNMLYCTPFAYTTANPAVLQAMSGLRRLAYLVLSLLFMIRTSQLALTEGGDWLKDSKNLLISLIGSVLLISQSVAIIDYLIVISNYLAAFITSVLPITLLDTPIQGMQLGELLAAGLLYGLLLILLVKAVARIVRLALMISLTPLMGMLFFLPQTRNRTTSWSGTLMDLLLQQFSWLFLLGLGSAFVAPMRSALPATLPEPVAHGTLPGLVFGVITLVIALNGERILGIAAVAQGGWVGQLVKTKLLLSTLRVPKLATRTAQTTLGKTLKAGGRAASTVVKPALNPFKNVLTGGRSRDTAQTAAQTAARNRQRSRIGQATALFGQLPGLKRTKLGQALQTAGLSPVERGRQAELRDPRVQQAEAAVADVRRAQRWGGRPARGTRTVGSPHPVRSVPPPRPVLAHIQTPGATPDAPTLVVRPAGRRPRPSVAHRPITPVPLQRVAARPQRGPQRRPAVMTPPPSAAPPTPPPMVRYQQALTQVTAEHAAERVQLDQTIQAGQQRLAQLQQRQQRLSQQITTPRPGSTATGRAARIGVANRVADQIAQVQTTIQTQQRRLRAISPHEQEAPATRRAAAARAGLRRAVDQTEGDTMTDHTTPTAGTQALQTAMTVARVALRWKLWGGIGGGLLLLFGCMLIAGISTPLQQSTQVWPVAVATSTTGEYAQSGWSITSSFGWRDNPLSGGPEFHDGIDLAGPTFCLGCRVPSTLDGQVAYVGWDQPAAPDPRRTGGGQTVIVENGDGAYRTLYAHLQNYRLYVRLEGRIVGEGQDTPYQPVGGGDLQPVPEVALECADPTVLERGRFVPTRLDAGTIVFDYATPGACTVLVQWGHKGGGWTGWVADDPPAIRTIGGRRWAALEWATPLQVGDHAGDVAVRFRAHIEPPPPPPTDTLPLPSLTPGLRGLAAPLAATGRTDAAPTCTATDAGGMRCVYALAQIPTVADRGAAAGPWWTEAQLLDADHDHADPAGVTTQPVATMAIPSADPTPPALTAGTPWQIDLTDVPWTSGAGARTFRLTWPYRPGTTLRLTAQVPAGLRVENDTLPACALQNGLTICTVQPRSDSVPFTLGVPGLATLPPGRYAIPIRVYEVMDGEDVPRLSHTITVIIGTPPAPTPPATTIGVEPLVMVTVAPGGMAVWTIQAQPQAALDLTLGPLQAEDLTRVVQLADGNAAPCDLPGQGTLICHSGGAPLQLRITVSATSRRAGSVPIPITVTARDAAGRIVATHTATLQLVVNRTGGPAPTPTPGTPPGGSSCAYEGLKHLDGVHSVVAYRNEFMIASIADSYQAVRAEVQAATGRDALGTIAEAWRDPGFMNARTIRYSWHKIGAAVDLNENGPFRRVPDGTLTRLYVGAFDLTAAFERRGWNRIPPQLTDVGWVSEWWHYELRRNLSWEAAAQTAYTRAELIRYYPEVDWAATGCTGGDGPPTGGGTPAPLPWLRLICQPAAPTFATPVEELAGCGPPVRLGSPVNQAVGWLGVVGMTGATTGPHLHLGLWMTGIAGTTQTAICVEPYLHGLAPPPDAYCWTDKADPAEFLPRAPGLPTDAAVAFYPRDGPPIAEGAPWQLPPPNYPGSLLAEPTFCTGSGQYWNPHAHADSPFGGGAWSDWLRDVLCTPR